MDFKILINKLRLKASEFFSNRIRDFTQVTALRLISITVFKQNNNIERT